MNDENLSLEHLALNYTSTERTWVTDLAAYAKQHGRPELSVVLEAAMDQQRRVQELAEAIGNQRETIVRLSAQIREATRLPDARRK